MTEGSSPWLLSHMMQAHAEAPGFERVLSLNPDVALFSRSFVAQARGLAVTPPIDLAFQRGNTSGNPAGFVTPVTR